MYALVDASSFYASAEKVFDPTIRKRPVVVLSNNDGCIVAVSSEAKKLTLPKFQPYFKFKEMLTKHNVVIRSSNYELYSDLSSKMMSIITQFSDNHHIYSIDEAFLKFEGYEAVVPCWEEYGHKIRRSVWQQTKLPVGVGFAPTLTLAKAANYAAKKFDCATGVAVINDDKMRRKVLTQLKVGDVWGVGRKLTKKLNDLGIYTALDLAEQSSNHLGSLFNVVLARTVKELNGIPCLSWDLVQQRKKEIFSTRSFGQRVTEPEVLKAALAAHCSVVAKNLRKQKSLTKRLYIFAHSSPFDNRYYKRSFIQTLPVASSDNRVLMLAVNEIFNKLYLKGIKYYKAGIGAIELEDEEHFQADLFNQRIDSTELMKSLDKLNNRYGMNTICLGTQLQSNHWHMKQEYLSPRYTTRWSDLPKIKC